MAANKTTQRAVLAFSPVRLPKRGRGAEIIGQVLGDVMTTDAGDTVSTESLKGYPINLMMAFARDQNIDPSQALADGINAQMAHRARNANPSYDIQRKMLETHMVSNEADARLAALYVRQLGKRTGLEPGEVLEALQLARQPEPK